VDGEIGETKDEAEEAGYWQLWLHTGDVVASRCIGEDDEGVCK
jgi:hypothetical protein